MSEQAERNNANAIAFYELMFNDNEPREAVERYMGAEYRQHNPGVGDGKEAFVEYFAAMASPGISTSTSRPGRWPSAGHRGAAA